MPLQRVQNTASSWPCYTWSHPTSLFAYSISYYLHEKKRPTPLKYKPAAIVFNTLSPAAHENICCTKSSLEFQTQIKPLYIDGWTLQGLRIAIAIGNWSATAMRVRILARASQSQLEINLNLYEVLFFTRNSANGHFPTQVQQHVLAFDLLNSFLKQAQQQDSLYIVL
jgi:hypothetical protein